MSKNEHHITPLWVYWAVAGALFVLTAITVAASYVDFNAVLGISWLNLLIAMAIATVKGSLVCLFFMHLFYDHKIYTLSLLTGLVTLGIFIVLTLFDTQRRGEIDPQLHSPIVPQIEYPAKP